MQPLLNREPEKKLIRVKRHKAVSLQPLPNNEPHWRLPPPSLQPSPPYSSQQQAHGHSLPQRPSIQQPMPSRSPKGKRTISPPPTTSKCPWYKQPLLILTRALVIFSLIGVIGVIGSATYGASSFSSSSGTDSTQESARPLATPSAPQQLRWTTTHTFSGEGPQKTATFTVNGDWRIVWSCDPTSVNGLDYPVLIEVDSPDGTFLDNGVDTRCQQNNTHGVNEMHVRGQEYLNVISLGDWAVQVQESY